MAAEERAVTVGGRTVTFERERNGQGYRVLVDGAAVPMTYEEKETRTTYAGDRVKILAPSRSVAYAPLAPTLLAPDPFMVSGGGPRPFRVSCTWSSGSSAIYNTVVYEIEMLILWFPADLRSVHIEWDHRVDLTS